MGAEAGREVAKVTETAIILDLLSAGELPGRVLNASLGDHGHPMKPVDFYHMMSKLEDQDLVHGFWKERVLEGGTIRERWFRPVPSHVSSKTPPDHPSSPADASTQEW